MSKVDAQRAMREARYDAARAASRARAATSASSDQVAPATAKQPTGPPPDATGQCGHRNVEGAACQRPAGHLEQTHRYR